MNITTDVPAHRTINSPDSYCRIAQPKSCCVCSFLFWSLQLIQLVFQTLVFQGLSVTQFYHCRMLMKYCLWTVFYCFRASNCAQNPKNFPGGSAPRPLQQLTRWRYALPCSLLTSLYVCLCVCRPRVCVVCCEQPTMQAQRRPMHVNSAHVQGTR